MIREACIAILALSLAACDDPAPKGRIEQLLPSKPIKQKKPVMLANDEYLPGIVLEIPPPKLEWTSRKKHRKKESQCLLKIKTIGQILRESEGQASRSELSEGAIDQLRKCEGVL
jgi:hypothetical protein